jgi:hypothetical protein
VQYDECGIAGYGTVEYGEQKEKQEGLLHLH